jgi:hypothetical protein
VTTANRFQPVRSPQATLADVVGSGPAAIEYVRRIFSQMGRPGDMQERVALYGKTEFPDYILDELFEPDLDPDGIGQPQPMLACNGRTHRALTAENRYDYRLWADAPMSWREVQSLLGRLRGFKIKGRG